MSPSTSVVVRGVLALLAVGLACGFAQAQSCTDTMDYEPFVCQFSDKCVNRIIIGSPGEDGTEVAYVCGSVDCCGQLVTDCTLNGDCPDLAPAQRKRVAEISETARVLVADCKGRYRVFRDAPARADKVSALLDDRLLR